MHLNSWKFFDINKNYNILIIESPFYVSQSTLSYLNFSNNEGAAPCNCHQIYKPVCALNGMTYPNACLAKCSNISDVDLQVGDCRATHPCDSNPCPSSTECIPYRRVCLSPASQCQQYVCAAKSTTYRRYLAANAECSISAVKVSIWNQFWWLFFLWNWFYGMFSLVSLKVIAKVHFESLTF